MAQSFPDFTATDAWQDLAASPAHAGIVNQSVTLQSKGITRLLVYFGGAAAPGGAGYGVSLGVNQSVSGSSDHIWVKGDGPVAVQRED